MIYLSDFAKRCPLTFHLKNKINRVTFMYSIKNTELQVILVFFMYPGRS